MVWDNQYDTSLYRFFKMKKKKERRESSLQVTLVSYSIFSTSCVKISAQLSIHLAHTLFSRSRSSFFGSGLV